MVKKFCAGPRGGPGGGTSYQHESLRLRRGVLQFTLPTSREHITLTHSHSRTYTPKDIIRTQKINLLGKNVKITRSLENRQNHTSTRASESVCLTIFDKSSKSHLHSCSRALCWKRGCWHDARPVDFYDCSTHQ